MAAFTITTAADYFTINKDGQTDYFVPGQLRVRTLPSDEKVHLVDVNQRGNTQYVINLADDTINIDSTTVWANFATLLAAVVAVIHPTSA